MRPLGAARNPRNPMQRTHARLAAALARVPPRWSELDSEAGPAPASWRTDDAGQRTRICVRSERPPGRSSVRATILILFVVLLGMDASPGVAAIRGLPFSRAYSLEDIGYVPRGSRLGFDVFDRVAVIHDGVYTVLNDTTWLNLADTTAVNRVAITVVVPGPDGLAYYGGRGSWGMAELKSDGILHPVSLVPPDPPAWTQSTTFEDVIVTRDGTYFASRSGVVYRGANQEQCEYFELPKASKAFRVGDKVFVSSFERPLQYLDVAHRTARDVPSLIFDGKTDTVVERATELDDQHALVSVLDGRILTFDGENAVPWPGQSRAKLVGRIAALQHLVDGRIAVAITGTGVFILSPEGEPLSSLTIPQYHRVSDLASSEPGVLWLINEDSIEKILYSSGLSTFGQRLGLPLDWPLVTSWTNRTFVASAGILYEPSATAPGATARFERLPMQPPNGAWSLSALGSHMLVGNSYGIYEAMPDGSFAPVAHVPSLAHLVMIAEGKCFAISSHEIALLEWDGDRWIETTPRIPGVQNPAIVHRAGRSVWIETGAAGVARVSRKHDGLELMMVDNKSWTESLWANVGVIDDLVVLTGSRNDRRFFSESTETWIDRPELMRLFDRSPAWLARMRDGAHGTIWATHNEGVVKFTPTGGDYEMDATSFDLINDRYPVVQVLSNRDVWVSASRSLYHVEQETMTPIRPASEPVLVSLLDSRQNVGLLPSRTASTTRLRLPYAQNSITFRFFSGSYAWRRTPAYEFRLNPGEPWSALDTGSLLRFPGLHEGDYQLQVRITGEPGEPGPPLTFPFEVLAPWHRTWPAYVLYTVIVVLAVFGTIRWTGYLARKRNRVLEQLVHERTSQLESTMTRLNDETRISATLAERDRLASEIHDSVQQGLSGAILQLDTTLTLPTVNTNLRARLNVVRNMVSYARQEVQHAVWDMESPLLEGNDLGEALRKLTAFVTSGSLSPKVVVSGSPQPLPSATTHHLLRIAQEATTNAIRHGAARDIQLHLSYQADTVSLAISDDGIGFDPDSVLNQAGHFGLRGIRARARKLHGALTITSASGEGTCIQVVVPFTTPTTHDHDAETERPHEDPNPACR